MCVYMCVSERARLRVRVFAFASMDQFGYDQFSYDCYRKELTKKPVSSRICTTRKYCSHARFFFNNYWNINFNLNLDNFRFSLCYLVFSPSTSPHYCIVQSLFQHSFRPFLPIKKSIQAFNDLFLPWMSHNPTPSSDSSSAGTEPFQEDKGNETMQP